MGVYIKVADNSPTSELVFIGSRTSANNTRFYIDSSSSGQTVFGFNNNTPAASRKNITQGVIFDAELNYFNSRKNNFNGILVESISVNLQTNNIPLAIFAYNNNGTIANKAKADLYELRLSDNSTVIHNYVPVTSSGVPGLYDTIDGVFYASSTSTAFIAPS